jgi:negative regulator of flagellin synthesis FlgM
MIDKISGVYGPNLADKTGAKKGYRSPKEGPRGDGVEFSSFAVELAKVSGELKKIPEIREQLVEDFRKQIAEGTYNPDMNKVARSLLNAGLLDKEG